MMKRLAVILALVPMLASASDLTPGTFELSGGSNLGFLSGSSELSGGGFSQTTDVTQWGLNGTGLYYVIPSLSVGARLAYNSLDSKFPDGSKGGVSSFFVGPAVQFETAIAPQFAFFALGAFGYQSDTTTATGFPDDKYTGFGLELEAGVKYFVVKNFSVNAGLGYQYASLSRTESIGGITPDRKDSGFGVNVGLSVYFGGAGH